MNKVNIDTKMITLIGKPLGQSFAARMQNAGYAAANLNYLYHYTEADSSHLKEIIDGVRYMPSYAGCAVTKPNKVAVMQYLDETDPLCKKIGSCNTVVKTPEGKLRGYNTDALGFYRSLVENGKMEAEGKTFFCFGAGGVGRAICCILAVKGAKRVYITDIYPHAAEELAADINAFMKEDAEKKADINAFMKEDAEQKADSNASVKEDTEQKADKNATVKTDADTETAEGETTALEPVAVVIPHGEFDRVSESDCVINASGIGFGSTIGQTPVPKEYLREGQVCFDACYNPPETKFLRQAKGLGLKTLNGLWMSLFQGVAQVELWSGKKAPVDAMRDELLTILATNKM